MGTLYVVATPIGNLNDMTFRAINTLKEASYILCEDTRTSLKLFNHFEIKNKLVSYHKFNEMEKVNKVIEDLKNDMNIALISDAGTPCISDPGNILVKKAREEGINVTPVGGISAFVTALSVSGVNTDKFIFYGFFPRETKDKNKLVKEIESSFVNTFVFYESPKRIIKTLEFLSLKLGNVKVSVFKELTKIHEKNYYGLIKDVILKLKEDDKTSLGEYTFILEKQDRTLEKKAMSIEALIVDEMIKNGLSLKDAVNRVNNNFDDISKKDIYNAGINLKELF
ncbi:MAG: 16S rRNA (cytidine(1402)-2'-O)-methyltransferase [Bacilli bacterium]